MLNKRSPFIKNGNETTPPSPPSPPDEEEEWNDNPFTQPDFEWDAVFENIPFPNWWLEDKDIDKQ